jgi:hypothetical protein
MKSLALKISMAVLSMIPLVAKAELIVLASLKVMMLTMQK